MSYRLTPRAVADITAIADYLNERNPAAAIEVISGFIRRFEMLARHPYSGVGREDILPNIRHLVLGTYVAFYRIEEGDAVIVRVQHGRRDVSEQDVN